MVDHPLVPDDVKSYLLSHNVEAILNKGLNVVLRELPQDPLSLMAATLIDSIVSSPVFDHFDARETVIADNQKSIKIIVYLTYQGKTSAYYTYLLPFNQEDIANFTFDKPEEKSGMKEACRIIKEEISQLLKGKDVLSLKKIDEMLLQYQKKQSENGNIIGDNIIKACSEALLLCYGFCISPASPYLSFFKYLKNREFSQSDNLPKIIFTIFNGGKTLGSKVKFSHFYLILESAPSDDLSSIDVFLKIQAQIRKQISSHKLGENGFKPGADGSYYNALENVNDTFKFLEDAINATQLNSDKKKYLKIGINPDIDTCYIKEQNKYDMEGPKNLFDQDQLTEYFLKMSFDHPLLEYIEDPMAEDDTAGFKKIIRRFKDALPRVRIGVKNWFKADIDIIKEVFNTQMIQKDEDEEEEKKEEKKEVKEEEKKEEIKEPPPPVVQETKGGRQSQNSKTGGNMKGANSKSQAKIDPLPPAQPEVIEDPNDPNRLKFIPNVIHLKRSQIKSSQKLWELILYQQSLKQEEQFDLMIEDCYYETTNSDIVDLAVGTSIGYLNIKGFFRLEKTQKVARFNEIKDELKTDLSMAYGVKKLSGSNGTFNKVNQQFPGQRKKNMMQLQDNEEIISEKQEMMRADSPLHSIKDDESDSKSSFDEFGDLKEAKDYSGVQQNTQKKKTDISTNNGKTHTNMNKEYYRKESKENCLTKKKSTEFLISNSQYPQSQEFQIKQNNIIIDLTNKMIEENKNQSVIPISNPPVEVSQQDIAIPKDIATQKDIEEFKKQIHLDLQKLAQVLEENNKKQQQQQAQKRETERIKKEIESQIQEQLQKQLKEAQILASNINDNSPIIINHEQVSNVSSHKDLQDIVSQQHSHKISTDQIVQYEQQNIEVAKIEKQYSLQQSDQKIGKAFAKGYTSNKGPQSLIQAERKLNITNSSVKSGGSSIANVQANNQQQQLKHSRMSSALSVQKNNKQNNTNNPHFYLNLNEINKKEANSNQKQYKPQSAVYQSGNRNQHSALRSSNSRDRSNNAHYATKSPKSYSSMASFYYKQSKSAGKPGVLKANQTKQSNNGSYIIMEEHNQQDLTIQDSVLMENEDLKQMIHQLRLKNAEQRNEISKAKRENQEIVAQQQQMEEKFRQMEKQRKKDCDYILKQENEIEKMKENKNQQINLIKVQEEQIQNLKTMLNQTINVKIKYENIIKRLVENERSRDLVLSIIEQMQQQTSSDQVSYQDTMLSPPQFKTTTQMNSTQLNSAYQSMNATQNMSQILANAAQKVMAKTNQSYHNTKIVNQMHLDYFKPSQDFDEAGEDEDEDQDQVLELQQQQYDQSNNVVEGNHNKIQQEKIDSEIGGQYYQAQKNQIGEGSQNASGEKSARFRLAEMPM